MVTEVVTRLSGREKAAWQDLLESAGLTPDTDAEQTVLLWDGDKLVGTGSRKGNLLKCIAVEEESQGEGLTGTILTALRQEAFRAGQGHLFLYTKPENQVLFSNLFFYPVAKTGSVLLMENQRGGLASFLKNMPKAVSSGDIGAAVMHCDPFTLGHRHLVEQAAKECSHVYVFVLSEDRGACPAGDRLEMVRKGTEDLTNVTVLPTGPYLISAATFPTYFLKDRDRAGQIQCQLDVEIFARQFAPYFGITHRYVGTEPLSQLTNQYNAVLKRELPLRGIRVREIPRLETEGGPVSASRVRALIRENDWEQASRLLPETTLAYLKENQCFRREHHE